MPFLLSVSKGPPCLLAIGLHCNVAVHVVALYLRRPLFCINTLQPHELEILERLPPRNLEDLKLKRDVLLNYGSTYPVRGTVHQLLPVITVAKPALLACRALMFQVAGA
jgi:hypothetical protein